MSDIKKLLETANRKCEMNWKVYSFNPEKDNELVEESPVFQCIKKAAEYKREVVEKHPDYIVEIVAESSQKNEGVHFGQPNVDKCYSELMDISFQEMKKRNGKELSDKEFEAFRPMLLKKYPKEVVDYCYMKANESAQKNEGKTIDDIPTRDLGKCLKEYRAKVGNNKVLQNSLAAIANEFQRCFNLASKPSIIQVGNILDNMPKEYVESAQINETRGYKVLVELGVPDNMNNRDIEDEVERLLRTSNKISVVMDVTAERK